MTHSLIERLEKLTGPDREVGNEILLACGWTIKTNQSGGTGSPCTVWWRDLNGEYFADGCQPDPTESIDAALTLSDWVLLTLSDIGADGLPLCVFGDPSQSPSIEVSGIGETLPLAICIAALRARAALEDKERG